MSFYGLNSCVSIIVAWSLIFLSAPVADSLGIPYSFILLAIAALLRQGRNEYLRLKLQDNNLFNVISVVYYFFILGVFIVNGNFYDEINSLQFVIVIALPLLLFAMFYDFNVCITDKKSGKD